MMERLSMELRAARDLSDEALLAAGANLYTLTSNGYNHEFIDSALGHDAFLNAHATQLFTHPKNTEPGLHYWNKKLQKEAPRRPNPREVISSPLL